MDWDTSLGGRDGAFPDTMWSRIQHAREPDTEMRQTALTALIRSYWRPVYLYIRVKWGKRNEDAKDHTQEFFLDLFEDLIARADPVRGRFRSLVKTALDRFLLLDHRKQGRIKRGGGRQILSLADFEDGRNDAVALPQDRTPEEIFDEAWKSEIFERALRRLEEEYRKEGKEVYYRVFLAYFLENTEEADYLKIAEKNGITVKDVSNYLTHAKRKLKDAVTRLVAETVGDWEDLQFELNSLFGESPAM